MLFEPKNKMKFCYITILILSLSNCMANNNDKSNLPENFNFENLQRWLNVFQQRSHSKSDTSSSISNSNGGIITPPQPPSSPPQFSSQNTEYYKERFHHRDTPLVIIDSDAGFDYDDDSFDYGLQQNSPFMLRSTKMRDISSRSSYSTHTHKAIFQSLCPTTSQIFVLSNSDYEYRPDRYQNITCSHPIMQTASNIRDKDNYNVCEQIGFRCVQHRRTMLLNVRRHGSDCWKTESITIDSGCECVMPA